MPEINVFPNIPMRPDIKNIRVDSNMTTVEVAQVIGDRMDVDPERLRLVRHGKRLDPKMTLSEMGIGQMSTIDVAVRMYPVLFELKSVYNSKQSTKERVEEAVKMIPFALGYEGDALVTWVYQTLEVIALNKCAAMKPLLQGLNAAKRRLVKMKHEKRYQVMVRSNCSKPTSIHQLIECIGKEKKAWFETRRKCLLSKAQEKNRKRKLRVKPTRCRLVPIDTSGLDDLTSVDEY
jgi:hypothetical protein